MIKVGSLGKVPVAERIRMLHVPRSALLEHNAAVILTLDHNPLATVQKVVNVHAALRVVHIAHLAVGARAEGVAVAD
jgi:hypothetical protein